MLEHSTPTTLDREEIRKSAFVEHGPHRLRIVADGPLADLTFAVKDVIDIAGFPTACGNPDRLKEPPATAAAPCVLAILAAGATCLGKTHTDEFALGIFGANPHFGMPINPKAPDRVPGGSSSGSASAVAGGFVDFALGTDTGASVRMPANFCGIYGLRTSFGRISTAGVMPMAPSFDTVGWMARDPTVLRRVGEVFFGRISERLDSRFLIARDAFDLAAEKVAKPLLEIARAFDAQDVLIYEEEPALWAETFAKLQLQELWSSLGGWVTKPGRIVGSRVRERVELASKVIPTDVSQALVLREAFTRRLATLLGDNGVLIIPTAHDLPPYRNGSASELAAFRNTVFTLTCIAGITRLPQISLPVAIVDGCPVGLSLIGGPYSDERLLALAELISVEQRFEATLSY